MSFVIFFYDKDFQIICMSETWLRPEVSDTMVNLPGYSLFRVDRIGKSGGGVAFYLMKGCMASIIARSDERYCGKPEFIVAEISLNGSSKLLLAVVYRPPKVGYLNEFENLFLDLQNRYRHSVILGDFNADMSTISYDSMQLSRFVSSSGLYLVPHHPTHHLKDSNTWLDLCIIDDHSKLIDCGQQAVEFLSAHDLIFITYKIRIQRCSSRHIICRDYRKFNRSKFLSELQSSDWSSLFNANCIDDKVEMLNVVLLETFDRHAPLKSIQARKLPAPWITAELREAMKERDKARRLWRRKRDDNSYCNFKKLRNNVQSYVRAAKSGNDLLPGSFWKIRQLS